MSMGYKCGECGFEWLTQDIDCPLCLLKRVQSHLRVELVEHQEADEENELLLFKLKRRTKALEEAIETIDGCAAMPVDISHLREALSDE